MSLEALENPAHGPHSKDCPGCDSCAKQDTGCLLCGADVRKGSVLCGPCLDDRVHAAAAERSRELVEEFMSLPARLRAVGDGGAASDVGLKVTR